ncbi:MAG: VanZ family protein [Bacteroidetes bacterium]|nr:VanZ family protein [Bacteroidota bacterium]MDA0980753.1 VanZ family protein [Bacteroidota bacterium]
MITPLLFVVISLTFLLLLPGNDLEASSWWETYKIDKLVHIVTFSILSLSTSITLSKLRVLIDTNYRLMTLILVVCTIFGTILEFLQQELRVGRSAELLDIVADCVGVLLGFVIFRTVYGVFPGVIPSDSVISNRRISQS